MCLLSANLAYTSVQASICLPCLPLCFLFLQEYMRKQQQEVAKREAAEKHLAAAAAAKRQAALKALVEKQKEVRWGVSCACRQLRVTKGAAQLHCGLIVGQSCSLNLKALRAAPL